MAKSSAEGTSGEATLTTILVIEPDILVRMVIADYLRDCGYKVVEGVNAAGALRCWKPEKRLMLFWPRFASLAALMVSALSGRFAKIIRKSM